MGLLRSLLLASLTLGPGCDQKKPARKKGSRPAAKAPPGTKATADTPRAAWKRAQKAVIAGDADGIWAFVSDKSRQWLMTGQQGVRLHHLKSLPDGVLNRFARAAGTTPAEMKKMSLKELARTVMVAEAHKFRHHYVGAELQSVKVDGSQALLVVKQADGKARKFVLIREGGRWKLDGEETRKLHDHERKRP